MADNKAQAPGNTAVKNSKDDKSVESLMDVFTNEEFKETAVSVLSKDLGDMTALSLLEEMQQVANEMGCGR